MSIKKPLAIYDKDFAEISSGDTISPDVLPLASTTAKGGIQLSGNSNQYLNGNGTFSTPPDNDTIYTLPTASTTVKGGIQLSGNANQVLTGTGFNSVPSASTTVKGGIQLSGNANQYLNGAGIFSTPASSDTFDAVNGGRLSCSATFPIFDGSGTVYFVPYTSNRIALRPNSSSDYQIYTFTQCTLSGTGHIYAYWTGSAVALYATTTAPSKDAYGILSSGIYRYIGYVTSANDLVTNRSVWNYNNQVARTFYISYNTAHSYGSTSQRIWGGSSAYTQLTYCVPWAGGRPALFTSYGIVTSSATAGACYNYIMTTGGNSLGSGSSLTTLNTLSLSYGISSATAGINYASVYEYTSSASYSGTFTSIVLTGITTG